MRWLLFLVAIIILVFVSLSLPQPESAGVLGVAVGMALIIAISRAIRAKRHLWLLSQLARIYQLLLAIFLALIRINTGRAHTIDNVQPASRKLVLAAEVIVILLMTTYTTRQYYQSPGLQYSGGEAEWLTSSVYAAHNGLREYGRIPLWQPYLEFGEPLLDNPFSFILNPFSSAPSLLLGGAEGIKISVVMTTALAGLGGWFLGWVLGFGTLGRLLLGLLLIGKGNMLAMFNTGYFQLAASQAYFPWIIAGIVAIFTHLHKRWPPVLLAVSAAMLLFAGNLWYTLPMFVAAGMIALFYLIGRRPRQAHEDENFSAVSLHESVKRLLLGGVLTVGISAVILLPVWINQGQIGKHPPLIEAGAVVPLWEDVIPFYFDSNLRQTLQVFDPTDKRTQEGVTLDGVAEHYYSYITPLWFVVLLCLGIPLYRPRWNRLAIIAWVMVIVCTLWGAGGQPLFLWLYDTLPFLRGWRFVGRALAVATFWIAILIAMRADSLWRIITTTNWQTFSLKPIIASGMPILLLGVLIVGSAAAAYQVNGSWNNLSSTVLNPIHADDVCVSWLRAQYPNQPLTVWRIDYLGITTLMNNRVRIFDVAADFEMSPMPFTMSSVDLTLSLPEFALPWLIEEQEFFAAQGYIPVENSPRLMRTEFPCLYHKPNSMSYAYTVPLRTLQDIKPHGNGESLPPAMTTPVTTYLRQPDNILLAVEGEASGQTVLTLQERAYPGWSVTVDGQPAKLQSVGGQLGVLLPSSPGSHEIYFEYRPTLLIVSAWITLVASLVTIGYLLRVDRLLPGRFRRNGERLEH